MNDKEKEKYFEENISHCHFTNST